MTKVYDVCAILALRGRIEDFFNGTGDYNIFFGHTYEEVIANAIKNGYEENECYKVHVEVSKNEKAIEKQS